MDEIIHQSMQVFFGVLQALILVVISGAFKMFYDVKRLKRDLNSCFKKIREIEKRIQELEIELGVKRNQEIMESSAGCRREGPTQ